MHSFVSGRGGSSKVGMLYLGLGLLFWGWGSWPRSGRLTRSGLALASSLYLIGFAFLDDSLGVGIWPGVLRSVFWALLTLYRVRLSGLASPLPLGIGLLGAPARGGLSELRHLFFFLGLAAAGLLSFTHFKVWLYFGYSSQ